MAKAILFDFWGTLVEQGVWSPIKQVKRILNVKLPFSEYVVRMQKVMMTKSFSSLTEAFEAVGKEFGITCDEEQLEELVGMWNKSWMLAKPYSDTTSVLQDLKKEYKLALVANSDSFSVRKVLEKFDLEKYFDEVYISYEKGMIKTEKDFLQGVLDVLQVKPEECVFVGDSIQSDMDSAERAGIKGILVDRKGRREFPTKICRLGEIPEKL